ncbi:TPA: hypothetical protein ACH3X2_001265 [Trebouxia sp. C0005]
MSASRILLLAFLAMAALGFYGTTAQTAGASSAGASTVSSAMSNLIQQFASTQSQSQLGLASQAFGLNSASKSSPYLSRATADSSALGSGMNKLSSIFNGASSGSSLIGNLSPMTIPQIVVEGLTINPDILDLDTAEAAFENFTSEYCSSSFFNASTEVPAVLEGPSLSVTLTTGTCAVVKNSTQGNDLSDLLEDSLTCIGPELSYTKSPAVFVSQYQSAASFSTKSCQLSVNTTDYFTKVLYSGGADVTYSSVQDFITALTNGDFVMGKTPSEQFVQVAEVPAMAPASSMTAAVSAAAAAPAVLPNAATPILPATPTTAA